MWDAEGGGCLQYKNDSERNMELRMHENCTFFFPVNIYSWCSVPAFLATRHTIVCLYNLLLNLFLIDIHGY